MEEHTEKQLLLPSVGQEKPAGNVEIKKTRPRSQKRANDLDGKTWQRNSISVWSDIRKTPEETKLGHPAMFPLSLVIRLIQCFTSADDSVVMDPFAGIGSTAIAAEMMGKVGVGIDISREFCKQARSRQPAIAYGFDESGSNEGRRFNGILLPQQSGERRIYTDSAMNLLNCVAPDSVDLVVTSPPYWDILLQERSADQKEIRHYGDYTDDLGRIRNYKTFLVELERIFSLVYQALRVGKYCCVVVMDLRKKNAFYPYHSDVAEFMQRVGFIYDDIIIWDRRHEYNFMRPLGYPYKFRINKAHEYILIFQKPD